MLFSALPLACLLAGGSTVNAQDCAATQPNVNVCTGLVANDFNGSDQFFGTTNGGFTYSSANGRYEINNIVANSGTLTTVFTSPVYTKGVNFPGSLTAGAVLTAGARAAVSGVTLNIIDYSTNAVIASCAAVFPNTANSSRAFCISVTNATTITAGRLFRYQFVITYYSGADLPDERFIALDNFSMGGIANSSIGLPVHFSGVEAKAAAGSVAINWNVDVELNVKGYEVERSADGIRFGTIGYVPAQDLRSYSFTDPAPVVTAYYRVKSVDVDGKVGYSPVVSVKNGKSSVLAKAFLTDRNTLVIQHPAIDPGTQVMVVSAEGRLVKSVIPALGAQQTRVDLSTAQPGLYIVRIQAANGEGETLKVMKQ